MSSLVLTDGSGHAGIADGDAARAGASAASVRRAIDWAAELGAETVIIPFFGQAELDCQHAAQRAARALRGLCVDAGERDVILCYLGHLPAEHIRELAMQIESAAFGCCVDLGTLHLRGLDAATELGILRELVKAVHLNDARLIRGDARPGLGSANLLECARMLEEVGYDRWVVVEAPSAPPELLGRELSFARSIFPRLRKLATPWPRFGVFSYDFDTGEWTSLAETCRRLGLAAVQLGSPLLDDSLAKLGEVEPGTGLLHAHGIEVAALAGYRNLVAPDPEKRRANIDFVAHCLEAAPHLGTAIVATETGSRNPLNDWGSTSDNWTAATWELLCDGIEELLEVAERCGTVLALEGYVANVLATTSQLERLLERFQSAHLQVVLDPYNYISSHLLAAKERIVSDFLDRFEARFVVAHLKDVSEQGAEVDTPEFGTGVFPQALYLDFLASRRPDLPIIIEHLPIGHVQSVVERVRNLCGRQVDEQ